MWEPMPGPAQRALQAARIDFLNGDSRQAFLIKGCHFQDLKSEIRGAPPVYPLLIVFLGGPIHETKRSSKRRDTRRRGQCRRGFCNASAQPVCAPTGPGRPLGKIALEEHFMVPDFVEYFAETYPNISPEIAKLRPACPSGSGRKTNRDHGSVPDRFRGPVSCRARCSG